MEQMKPKMTLKALRKKSPHIGVQIYGMVCGGVGTILNRRFQEDEGHMLGVECSWEMMERMYNEGHVLVFGRQEHTQMILLFFHEKRGLYRTWGNGGIPNICSITGSQTDNQMVQAYYPQEEGSTVRPEYEGPFVSFLNEDGSRAIFLIWQPELRLYGPFGNPPYPFIFERTGEGWRVLNMA